MTIYNINGPNPLQRIMSIPTHAFVTSIQINHFCDFRYDCPPWHLVKTIGNCIMTSNWFKVTYAIYTCN